MPKSKLLVMELYEVDGSDTEEVAKKLKSASRKTKVVFFVADDLTRMMNPQHLADAVETFGKK